MYISRRNTSCLLMCRRIVEKSLRLLGTFLGISFHLRNLTHTLNPFSTEASILPKISGGSAHSTRRQCGKSLHTDSLCASTTTHSCMTFSLRQTESFEFSPGQLSDNYQVYVHALSQNAKFKMREVLQWICSDTERIS